MAKTNLELSLPSEAEAILANDASRVLLERMGQDEPLRFRILDDSSTEGAFSLPAAAVRLLLRILEEMARGNAITLMPVHPELTTQEAADLLQISRPSLLQLLDEGKIESRRDGTHRRVRFEKLMDYKREAVADRRKTLKELSDYDQKLGV